MQNQKHGIISVLIPMYRSGSYIYDAVKSVHEQDVDCQLVIVDDGSEDDSLQYAKKALEDYEIKDAELIISAHLGQAASRNTALSKANGEYIIFLDADDVLAPCSLENMLKWLHVHSEADGVCTKCVDFISPELTSEEKKGLMINKEPYYRMLSGCTMFRKAVYDKVGRFDETLPSSETAQWMIRMKSEGFVVGNLDVVTLNRRYHNNNFGRISKQTQIESYMKIIKQQRRKKGADD